MSHEYLEAQMQRLFAEESAELGIEAFRRDDILVVRGEVESEGRRADLIERIAAHFPHLRVRNEITIVRVTKPVEAEHLTGA
jgi:hypothetical protein